MAKRKIFDITPPLVKQKEEQLPTRKKMIFSSPEKLSRLGKQAAKGGLILISLGIVFLALAGYFLIEPAAEIEVWPKQELVYFEEEVIIDCSVEEIYLPLTEEKEIYFLPGEIIKTEKVVSQEFSASGTKLKTAKARGIIRVYNNYSTYSQPLVATTRFVSAEGKLFRTPKRVVIPGASYQKGKLVPGSIDIEVVADQPGEEYNIGPSTFSIPGFAGTAKYTGFYAKSFSSMSGGMKKEVPQVSQADLDQAREILTEKALKESRTALENLLSRMNLLTFPEAISQEIVEVTPWAEVGQEVDRFLFQVKAKSQALVFKKSDLEDFAQAYLRAKIFSQPKELQEDSLKIKYSLREIDLAKGKIFLNLEISGKIYQVFDYSSLRKAARNRKPEEIEEIIKNFPAINKSKVRLWPFWITRLPENSERIGINLHID